MNDFGPVADHPTAGLGRRLAGNLGAQTATFAVTASLGMTTTMVLARSLGPEGFGGFKFLFAFIYFFQTLNDLGLNSILIRDLARDPDRTRELVQNTLGFKILLALGSLAIAWMAAAWWPGLGADVRWAIAIFALILPIQAMTLPSVTLHARVMIRKGLTIELANRLMGFAGMMTAIVLGYQLIGVTIALVIGELAGLAAVILTTRRFVPPEPSFRPAVWREVLRSSLPLGVRGLLISLVNRADFLLLQLLLGGAGLQAVAYYATAYQVTGVLERLPVFVMTTLYPVMSRLVGEDPRALATVYHRSLRNFVLAAVPVVIVVSLAAPFAVRLLGGAGYDPAIAPLRILIWSTGFFFPSAVASQLLIALGKPALSLGSWVLAAPINIGLNLMLIPQFGASGAALATAASFFAVLVVSLTLAERELRNVVSVQARIEAGAMSLPTSTRVH